MKASAIIFFVLLTTSTFGQSKINAKENGSIKSSKAKIYSIIIGINNYKNVPSLSYASTDADNFYNLLISPVFNVDPTNIGLLTDSSANRSNIYKEMYDLEDKLQPNDLLIFYFAGHGDIESKIQTNNSLLLLQQCPSKNYLRSGEYLDMNTLKDYFVSLSSKKVRTYFICDACHSGNLIGGIEGQRLTTLNLQQSWTNEIKLLSCQPNELSQEGIKWGSGRGVFTYFLELACKGLADNNGDNKISLGELKRYLENQVASNTDDKQNPMIIGDPKTLVCNVDQVTLTALKQNESITSKSRVALVTRNRGISEDDEKVQFFDAALKSKSELQPLNENVIITAGKILADDSLKEYWPYAEKQLFEYCNLEFNRLIQFYYDGTAMQPFSFQLKDLEAFLENSLPYFSNKLYKKDIYVKYKFIQIENAGLNSYSLPRGTTTSFLKTLLAINELSPGPPFIIKKMSEVYFALGKFDESYKQIINYTLLLPNDPYAYNFAGMALFKMQENDKAIESLKTAIALKDDYFDAYYNLGTVYNKIGNKSEAQKAFEKARAIKQPKMNEEY